ncbi:MAG: hypothetical protein FRX49_13637 [Trebouxia sp. A1-2]|nr:MAG: hypothetical protein FRX49_13637 [Trebouxia sp. A1-2]
MSRASHSDGATQARAIEAANADLTAVRNEFYFKLPGWLEARLRPLLQDQRDENNWYPKDLSSTEPYQRDYFPHFLIYWLRYLVGIWIELPLYAIKAQRWRMVLECLSFEAVYTALVAFLWHINQAATVWTLIVPLMVTSFALMFGNWSQHIFINPDMPRNAHGMSYNCIGFGGNQRSFNDGYHTIHHLNYKLHWTQLPQRFIRCTQQQTLPGLHFEGIGFFDVGWAVFLGNYKKLTTHLVCCSSPMLNMSYIDVMSLLTKQLEPIKSHL